MRFLALPALCLLIAHSVSAAGPSGPASAPPVSVQTLTFTQKAVGKRGGFGYRLENRSAKPVAQVVIDMGFRDGDGVLEKWVPFTRTAALAPGAKSEEKSDDFFMSETTRSVTLTVSSVTFANGTKWTVPKSE